MTMKIDYIYSWIKKTQSLCRCSWNMTRFLIFHCYRYLLFKTNTFIIYFLYLLSISSLGFAILKAVTPRTTSFKLRNIDLFFTSVSSATVSSMMTLEMEVFSQGQLMVMTVLMFLGGEIFAAMAGLHLTAFKMGREPFGLGRVESVESTTNPNPNSNPSFDRIELSVEALPERPNCLRSLKLKLDSIKFLGFVVLSYILAVHVVGIASVFVYLSIVSSAGNVLKKKGIQTFTFTVFIVVSTFANCGFIPTNENLIVFSKNAGLLLLLIPQILLGNTMFPAALRLVIWMAGKKKNMRALSAYWLENTKEAGFRHLLPRVQTMLLVTTGLGFLFTGFTLYSSMEWQSQGFSGMNTYQKVVGIIFQCINTRHSGENIVDLSTVAPAVLVFFLVMMYLPPYTTFVPILKSEEEGPLKIEGREKRRKIVLENLMFSQLSYIAIFIVLICITESKSLKEDPINFSLLNIAFEVLSAYGNVGLTTGYSCDRQIRPDPKCVNKWYGLAGKWSDEGKIVLIAIMFFGKLKKFNAKGGRAWKQL